MLIIGSNVIYGSNGVCKITDIRNEMFCGTEKQYYILKPTYTAGSVIYVPLDNELLTGRMKQILTTEEIYELIKIMPDEKTSWIDDNRLRSERYKEVLAGNNRRELVQMIKTINARKQEQEAKKKKLWSVDEGILAKAQKILYDEFALVLNIKQEDVVPFITQQIQVNEKEI